MKKLLFLIATIMGCASLLYGDEASREQVEFFESKIRPVLIEHCLNCHSEEARVSSKLKGGLLLDSREGWQIGGDNGPAIVPGKPQESGLLSALTYEHDVQMPPAGKLSDRVIEDFKQWIQDGAIDPRTTGTAIPIEKPKMDLAEAKKFWSFQRPQEHLAPVTQHEPLRKMDSFVLAKLESQQLKPAPVAEPRVLIRRLYLDLIGVPPTVEQVDAFTNDPTEVNYEKIVEQLLSSPAYGERWARLWLDVARYAEDQAHIVGEDKSLTYPNAYLYRDWVIDALNRDLDYSDFIRLQVAADLIEGEDSENLAALGFLGLGPKYYDRGRLFVMAEEWEDRVDVISRGVLGLTVACARCHDHKYDPIKTGDYYGLAGVFASTQMFNKPLKKDAQNLATVDEKAADGVKRENETKKSEEPKNPEEAMHIVREGKPTDLHVFVRGDVDNKGALVTRGFLPLLTEKQITFTQGSGRRELAEALVDSSNPVTARVIVNRIWGAYFGKGIVGTASNFGTLGERPTHPELLDDLTARFVNNGSSLKWLHREIVLSRTYRQSSQADAETLASDPENRWLARMSRRRLGAEGWRDALLAATGQLDRSRVGGTSIDPSDAKQNRRTVYSRISRLELNRFLALYDFPDPNVTAEKRAETTTPLQKLFVINSPFMIAQAEALETKVLQTFPAGSEDTTIPRVTWIYRTVFGRPPTDYELRLAEQYLSRSSESNRLKSYAHAILATNELQFVD
ncbi:MAG: hypothetical protein RLY14_1364 [Planctomycetota bacterium]|jgi:hypothetical protein